ncbi:MAG TPA: N-methyl-L-tryptophan oxidase [Actinomycetes bacterium]
MDADVVVVGAGTAGSATLWQLAQRGVHAIGVDQFEPGHSQGSGHGESRIIRTAYHEHPAYVPLVRSAWQLWRSLEAATGTSLLTRTGAVMIGPADGELITGVLAAVRTHDLPYEQLDQAACRDRFPQHILGVPEVAVVEPDAGFLRPELAIRTMVAAAVAAGATLITATPVRGVEAAPGGARVLLDSGTLTAKHVVICAGAWVSELLPLLRAALQVERQVQAWFPVRDRLMYAPERFPVFIRESNGHFLYGIPSPNGHALKVGIHHEGVPTSPRTIDRSVSHSDIAMLTTLVNQLLREVEQAADRASVCMYTNAPDGHFVIGAAPGFDNVTVVSACSGHGFKFAPVLGEIAADLAVDGGTQHPIALFDPARLR